MRRHISHRKKGVHNPFRILEVSLKTRRWAQNRGHGPTLVMKDITTLCKAALKVAVVSHFDIDGESSFILSVPHPLVTQMEKSGV
jgi:hypothetical protein